MSRSAGPRKIRRSKLSRGDGHTVRSVVKAFGLA